MSIRIIKCFTDPIMFSGISKKENVKDLLVVIKHQFKGSVKGRLYSGVHRNFQTSFKFLSCIKFGRNFLYGILSIL